MLVRPSHVFLFPPRTQQPVGPARRRLRQAPAELLGHDVTHPVAPAADAGAASGAGAPGAPETTSFPVPTNHSGPDPGHQCQCPRQSAACIPGADGGAQGKQPWLQFVVEEVEEEEVRQHV